MNIKLPKKFLEFLNIKNATDEYISIILDVLKNNPDYVEPISNALNFNTELEFVNNLYESCNGKLSYYVLCLLPFAEINKDASTYLIRLLIDLVSSSYNIEFTKNE